MTVTCGLAQILATQKDYGYLWTSGGSHCGSSRTNTKRCLPFSKRFVLLVKIGQFLCTKNQESEVDTSNAQPDISQCAST